MKCLILGGGVSGLAMAWQRQRAGQAVEVWEAEAVPGGWVQTLPWPDLEGRPGWLERGPLGLNCARKSPLESLIRSLGIPVHTAPKGSRRWVGQASGREARGLSPLTWPERLALLAEPFRSKKEEPESLEDFFSRRLGAPFATRVLPALVNGLLAAPAAELDRDTLPQLGRWEAEGGLLRGLLREGLGRHRPLTGGMGSLTKALAEGLPLRLAHPALDLGREGSGWWVEGPDGVRHGADQVLLALPPKAAQALLARCAPEAAALFGAFPSTDLCLVHSRHAPVSFLNPGFSLLMDPEVGGPFLGTVGLPLGDERVPPDCLQVRTCLRFGTPESVGLAALRRWIPELGPPLQVRTETATGALPRFPVGQARHRASLQRALPEGLDWTGAWRHGPGLGELVRP